MTVGRGQLRAVQGRCRRLAESSPCELRPATNHHPAPPACPQSRCALCGALMVARDAAVPGAGVFVGGTGWRSKLTWGLAGAAMYRC